ncbi:DUF2993 domain-containing protein [Modestobacter sp. Leaf380]|uniref:LmeA family phospholipid-binding protein n=1 Tax=Modestobacter sp. Leaf380 TaxID=1736356 RepID=UPI0007021197|nr:DUF2993 domain-containing protein [Modestobacter sp. Leaf380]KQS73657.1 hypothetical protein ASG41_03320 [Modestobacter sp. Leaf380]
MKGLLITVLVLLGLLVAADRVGVVVAEDQVAAQVAQRGQLTGEPEVDITGFPFLTQALGGRYEDVRLALTADQLGLPDGGTAEVSLQGVQLPLSDVIAGDVAEIPVEHVDGRASLSWGLLSSQLDGDTQLSREGDGVRVTRTVEVLGQSVRLTAAGQVALDGQDLVVTVDQAAGAGVDVPDFLLDAAQDLLDFRYTVPALPFGLQLTGLTTTDSGVDLTVEATDTVLR